MVQSITDIKSCSVLSSVCVIIRFASGLLWIRQDSMMPEVHAEVRFASLKSRKKIVANDENYALAA
jgi:hypothetical protein